MLFNSVFEIIKLKLEVAAMRMKSNIPEVMKTGSANLNFLCNFSQLSLSNISLFTVLFTAYVGFFRFFSLLSGKGYVFKWM